MPYDARALANVILDGWDARAHSITNKKINKLLFYAQGFSLVRLQTSLISNHFEAWEHGPVVRVVYDSFKSFGFKPITTMATYFDYRAGAEVVARAEMRAAEQSLFERVVGHFMQFSGDALELMAHEAGGPWHQVRFSGAATLRGRIPEDLIHQYFSKQVGVLPV